MSETQKEEQKETTNTIPAPIFGLATFGTPATLGSKTEEPAEPENKEEEEEEGDGGAADIEKDEDVLFQARAKLWRFEKNTKEWKERGQGDIKLLKHKETGKIRVLMRREKTYKVCANHLVISSMKLQPNAGSDRSWVYTSPADYADGEAKAETLAVRFAKSEVAQEFKTHFEAAQVEMAKIAGASS